MLEQMGRCSQAVTALDILFLTNAVRNTVHADCATTLGKIGTIHTVPTESTLARVHIAPVGHQHVSHSQ